MINMVIKMNGFEINRIFNRMLDNTRVISIQTKIYFLTEGLAIDKNNH